MKLSLDGGLATLGYALVDQSGGVHELGVLLSESNAKKLGKNADRVARLEVQAANLDAIIQRWRQYLTGIVAEALSFKRGSVGQIVSLSLFWGEIVGLGAARGLPIRHIAPKTWQKAVAPQAVSKSGAIDYDIVFEQLAAYVGDQGAHHLRSIKPGAREHALDAVGVGVYDAMMPDVRLEAKRRKRA